ncbi:unnamed protein product [Tetraodon nigroviridis]|uniref:(spotted green pufferfish) hypothetical protein n=1 Tax=Tetraodon nigroviridis TaxID=99883 RepID=Q4SB01_TETNG|nr:unnamed protein product [Tetraodon nigroviridis]
MGTVGLLKVSRPQCESKEQSHSEGGLESHEHKPAHPPTGVMVSSQNCLPQTLHTPEARLSKVTKKH